MSGYIPFTDEQKEKARRTDLAGLLRSQGETLRKSGSELEWLDGSQKVTIRRNLWFHHYEQVGGDSIDFVRKFYHKSYPEAMEYLLGGELLSVQETKLRAIADGTGTVTLILTGPGVWTVTAALDGKEKSVEVEVSEGYSAKIALLSRLPEGYTELEYIQSSGTQCINTGMKRSGSLKLIMDVEPLEDGGTQSQSKYFFDSSYLPTSGTKYVLRAVWSSKGVQACMGAYSTVTWARVSMLPGLNDYGRRKCSGLLVGALSAGIGVSSGWDAHVLERLPAPKKLSRLGFAPVR